MTLDDIIRENAYSLIYESKILLRNDIFGRAKGLTYFGLEVFAKYGAYLLMKNGFISSDTLEKFFKSHHIKVNPLEPFLILTLLNSLEKVLSVEMESQSFKPICQQVLHQYYSNAKRNNQYMHDKNSCFYVNQDGKSPLMIGKNNIENFLKLADAQLKTIELLVSESFQNLLTEEIKKNIYGMECEL